MRVPVVSIAVSGTVFDKMLKIKARECQLIGVSPEFPDQNLFDSLLQVPTLVELLSTLMMVIPMQL